MSNEVPKEESKKKEIVTWFMEYLQDQQIIEEENAEDFFHGGAGGMFGLRALDNVIGPERRKELDPKSRDMFLTDLKMHEDDGAFRFLLWQRMRRNPTDENIRRYYFVSRVCDRCQESDLKLLSCYALFDERGNPERPSFFCERHVPMRAVKILYMSEDVDVPGNSPTLPDPPKVYSCAKCNYHWTSKKKNSIPKSCPRCHTYKY